MSDVTNFMDDRLLQKLKQVEENLRSSLQEYKDYRKSETDTIGEFLKILREADCNRPSLFETLEHGLTLGRLHNVRVYVEVPVLAENPESAVEVAKSNFVSILRDRKAGFQYIASKLSSLEDHPDYVGQVPLSRHKQSLPCERWLELCEEPSKRDETEQQNDIPVGRLNVNATILLQDDYNTLDS